MTISDNLITISFVIALGLLWSLKGRLFGFVISKVTTIRDSVHSAQRQRLEANMHLKQTQARGSITANEGLRALENSREEALGIQLHATEVANDILARSDAQAAILVANMERALLNQHRAIVIKVATDIAARLLEENKSILRADDYVLGLVINT